MIFPQLSLEQACAALADGEAIIYPTETFFAIGCNALNADAVGRIFSIKRRALHLPLPVIISDKQDLSLLSAYVPETAQKIMDTFWPGSVSVVLPAKPEVPELLTAGVGRIAVRFSPHPAPAALRERCGVVLTASSANLSGEEAVAGLEALNPELAHGVAGIFLHGPEPAGGLPSTVLDVVEGPHGSVVRILRAGAVTAATFVAAGFTVEEKEEHCG